jgi:uncharacterized protein YukE
VGVAQEDDKMATLKDYDSPKVLLKRFTGQSDVETFEKIKDRVTSAATAVEGEANKMEKVIDRISPETEKLREGFLKVVNTASLTITATETVVQDLRNTASDARKYLRDFENQIKMAREDADALENMYETLEKALEKAAKSGVQKDQQAAEIAAKAYEKACRNAQKSFTALNEVSRETTDRTKEFATLLKANYFDTIKTIYQTMAEMKKFAAANEQELRKADKLMAIMR